jgi:hypothetical protein
MNNGPFSTDLRPGAGRFLSQQRQQVDCFTALELVEGIQAAGEQ